MSRGYQVQWVSAKSCVEHSDHVEIGLSLLDILPKDQMGAMLRDELERDGWTKQADGTLQTVLDGTTVILDKDGTSVRIEKTASKDVSVRSTNADDADRQLTVAEERAKEQMGAELTKVLVKAEGDVRASVDKAVQKVYVEALKKKAASMGDITSIVEGQGENGALEVTIKVRA